jgi:aminopeptidase N
VASEFSSWLDKPLHEATPEGVIVPGVNLTRAEAAERSSLVKVHSYDVDLDLTQGSENFIAKVRVKFDGLKPGATTFIDAVGKSVMKAELNGTAFDPKFDGESIFLPALAPSNELYVEFEGIYSNSGEGLHRFEDPADGEVYLYTQHEVPDARRTFVCFDQPDLKATFAISATVPAHWEVISNNPVASTEAAGSNKKWNFTTTPRISTYLTALVAGPYFKVESEYKGEKVVPLGLYCRKSLAEHMDAEELFDLTRRGFAAYEREFGLAYPFDKYDQIAVAEFNAGAMENAGCVTFAENYFVFRSKVTDKEYNWRANVILHEMAHMWFGDLVTMSWWDDLWLNESFAEWASYYTLAKATRFTNSWTVFNAERKNWAYRQDQLSSTHPIAVDMYDLEAVKTNFDGITYAKGASVLQQLVAYVGIDPFVAGLKQYFAKHAWGNTTLNDLIVELEATSGRDLGPWISTWLQTAGVNTFRPEITLNGDKYASVAVKQEVPLVPAGSTELRPHRMGVGLYDIKGDKVVLRKRVELDVAGASTAVADFAGEAVADLLVLNDGDVTYGKLRFDERSIATLKSHLGNIEDSLTRALAWSAVWDMTRDGELAASDYVPMVLKGLASETDVAVVATQVLQLESAVELYAADKNRDALRITLADGLEALLDAAAPGSDMQLQYVRSFASNAFAPQHVARVRSIFEGNLSGLTVDANLRWALLNSLVERGNATIADIEKELANDKSADGEKFAAFGRASGADAATKAAAWDLATTQDISNHIQIQTLRGFQCPRQRALTAPYADKYFDLIIDYWTSHTYEFASNIAMIAFPVYQISDATLAKAEGWLSGAGKDAPNGLRRIVSEQRDALARALKAQRKDS